jgi:hypothetical protein
MIVPPPIPRPIVAFHINENAGPDDDLDRGGCEIEPGEDVIPRGIGGEGGPGGDQAATIEKE